MSETGSGSKMLKRVVIALLAGAVLVGAAIVLLPGGAARTSIAAWRQRLTRQSAAPAPVATSTPAAAAQGPPSQSSPPVAATAPVDATAGGNASSTSGALGAVTAWDPADDALPNLALEDRGGHVDQVTGAAGPGYQGLRLIDGAAEPAWTAVTPTVYPQEITFSFYEQQPALVGAVAIDAAEPSIAPLEVEVSTAADSSGPFTPVAHQQLAGGVPRQKVSFAPVEARAVKLRVVSGQSKDRLGLAEVRILEAARAGYTPLFSRQPGTASWKGSPREAAQMGLDWLQQAAIDWSSQHACFGCHVQAQAIMGQTVAAANGYVVSRDTLKTLVERTLKFQDAQPQITGAWFDGSISATQFATMALAHARAAGEAGDESSFRRGVDWLLTRQDANGSLPFDRPEPPIIAGRFMTTANAAYALMKAHDETKDARYRTAADRGVDWIATHAPETTQDRVFKVLALSWFGTAEQKRLVTPVLEDLLREQQPDGGWKEIAKLPGSNALATGQVLYALKQSGASLLSTSFRRGVQYLLKTQVRDISQQTNGAWKATNTESGRPSDFAHTMWPVIGLAGSYGAPRDVGSLQIVLESQRDKPASRNLEIVLDASGSMKLPLGKSTRWRTALDVLKQLLDSLPADLNVGLRVYGHRFPSRALQTCTDSELVVPVAGIDRARILTRARGIQPRGETPLVFSVLQTVDDLRALGHGSVVLITDGEESCKGDPAAAAERLKASGVDLTLNIVGFTLNGKATAAELGTLAAATGGRYYEAQNGDALARALSLASMRSVPYEVFDASGRSVRAGSTSPLGIELPPGTYRLVLRALGQDVSDSIRVSANEETVVLVSVRDGRLAIAR